MGLNVNATKLLLHLKAENFAFGNVITLGRQRLNVSKFDLQKNLDTFGQKAKASELKSKNNGYCEPFLELLGATRVDSMDVSNYENATVLHDLNNPIPHSLKNRFTTVIDSGTLEHVFNFPVAIKNCMEMIEVSGTYIGITPCNNFFGHGFYQFSPELYYRVFSTDNGFEVKKMYFFVDEKNASVYEVKDPLVVRERVILNNAYPSFLMVVAHKHSVKNIFATTPQQSDYENIIWKQEKVTKQLQKFIPKPLRKLPRPLKKIKEGLALLRKQTGTADERFFKKIL